jgi:tight adherence protein B
MDSPELMQLGVALLAAIAFAAVAFAIIQPLVSGDRQKDKRVSDVTESRTKKVASRTAAEVAASRRKAVSDTLKDIDTRQKSKEKVPLRVRLQQAGLDATPKTFWIASAVLGAACAAGVYLSLPPTPLSQVGALVTGFVGTFGLPRWILAKLIKRRQSKFLAELANAIDVVVRGVKSGLPLNAQRGDFAAVDDGAREAGRGQGDAHGCPPMSYASVARPAAGGRAPADAATVIRTTARSSPTAPAAGCSGR